MKKNRFNEIRRSGRKLAHLLHLHTNIRGEVSLGLQIAIQIAGPCLSARLMSPRESDLESGALLLEGRNHRVLWSPGERLAKLKQLADTLQADWIANWDGYAKTKNCRSNHELPPISWPSSSTTPLSS